VAGEVAQGAGESGPPDTTASAKADIVKPCVIPLLKELTYCSLSSWSVSSRPLLVVELIGQLARMEADDGFSHEIQRETTIPGRSLG